MVTDCFGARAWDISDAEVVFVSGLLSAMRIVIPAALAVLALRLFTRRKKENHRVPGLFER
jgi:hypothetical protein